ncbi:hypothetical protein J14TS2_02890 [Bacillus sp. J14TS2]|uniref:hypothetical protein n=1 Tax=Bacillus sp. J14TS2 TaxID=2807188 RepID=UPI001B1BAF38|nr:hypothetical protein [Bacillus sp. J14TS2]GIN69814.1 hypothetical protein J14TS2_02890 [Bacillus sp. J14TS2]
MGMNKADRIRVYDGIEELQTQELTRSLSIDERQELDDLYEEVWEKDRLDCKQSLQESYINLFAFRNGTMVDEPVKYGLMDRVLQRERREFYRISVSEEEDLHEDRWQFSFTLEVRELIEQAGLEREWPQMLPVNVGSDLWDVLKKEEVTWLQQLPKPSWCYMKMVETAELERLAADHSEDMLDAIKWLKKLWGEGYQIYGDAIDLFYFS